MIAVCVLWNEEPDGTPIDMTGVDLDDLPRSYYGPFDSITDAINWMENDWPDDRTDTADVIADVFDVSPEQVNDPNIIFDEDAITIYGEGG